MAEKIQKSNVREIVELNMVQKGMLYHYLKDANENVYNVQLSFSIKGDLNIDLLKSAFGIVQSKNEALRSVFRWEKLSKPVQIILKECPVDFFYNDISDEQAESAEASIEQLGEKDKNDRFDLTKMPIRIRVIKSGPQAYTLNISNHHILFDGWSTGIFLKELLSCYNQLNAGQEPIFSPKASYRKVQEALRKSATTEKSVQYWKDYLEGHEVAPLLSYGSTSSKQVKNRIFSTPSTKFKAYARQHKVTQASVIYAAYGLLLQQYTAAAEVIFGTSVSSRDATIEGVNDVVGNFFNTIPLRIKNLEDKTLTEVVTDVHHGLIERNSYNSTSLSDIKESLDFNIDNLYDTVLGVENYPLDEAAIKGNGSLEVNLKSVYENTNFPVAITVFIKDTLEVNFMYKEGLVSDEYIEFMARNFIAVLNHILDDGSQPVKSISLSAQPEELALFQKINATTVDFAADTGIHELFEEQVAQSGDKPALEYNGQILSYAVLNTRADRLAALLQTEPGNIVGILLERSPELIISILAILKAGCSYLPINDELPDDRISYILSDSQCSKVITSAKYESRLASIKGGDLSVVNIDQLDLESKPEISQPLEKSANDLAYTIYTSGTTGKPKGVAIGHRSLVNYIQWAAKQYVQGEEVAFPLYTSISFDLTVTSIFTPLITGNKLVIYGQEEQSLIDKVIDDNKVNVIKLTPSHLKLVRENLKQKAGFKSHVKRFILGGEALETGLAKEVHDLFGGDIEIYNEYGPTEATVGCMIYRFDPEQQSLTVPIGVPIDNTKVFVLDEDQQLQPIGVTGQLYIAGAGLAQGYLNKEALTKEKFIANPQASGELMYKSGDLARWLPSGNLEFLGRTDDQVKIRGYRIELGEVEASLQKHPLLKEVAVLVKGEGTDRFLVAYYVCEQELNNDDELKEVLESELPAYMIPGQFVKLDSMPVNANGKLDRKALPEPDTTSELSYEAPANELEEGLVDIWSAVLKLEKEEISVTQTFMELGGHSLKIILMLNRVFKQYNVLIPVNDIFNHSSVRALAGYMQELTKADEADSSGLEKTPEKAHYQLSAAQKRLYFLYEFDKTSLAYNGITTLRMEGEVDVAKLEQVFKKLIARHEVLRSSFTLVDEQPVQIIAPEVDFSIEQFKAATQEVETIIKAFTRPFDLAKAPLLRVGLLQVAEEQHLLMVDIHHIISDGVSGQILIKEFMALYKGESLTEPEFQYKDFAEWQQAPAQQEAIGQQQEFWVSEFTEETPKLDLPTDFARPMIKNYQGSSVQFEISSEQTSLLKKIAERETTSMFTLMLSAYNILLSRLTNQEDIVVGTPVAGRNLPEVEQMLGMFVNTLALRSRPKRELSFKEFMAEVKAKSLACFDHQDYPYEALVDTLNIDRDVSRNPLFDTMFAYQNYEKVDMEVPGLTITVEERELTVAQFDLTLRVHEVGDKLSLTFEYASQLFQKETIERIAQYLTNIVSAVTADMEVKIHEIDLLPEEERSLLLNDFNNTDQPFQPDRTIVSAFQETIQNRSGQIALVAGDETLTFVELNEKSNQLARKIVSLGTSKEDIIGIMLSRSKELIISIMGVLKAGCAYVPLDPDYPVDRVKYIASHSGLKILLSEPSLDGIREHLPADIQVLDVTNPALALEEKTNLAIDIAPSNLAYMIYTSGSTGQPKGVMVEHRNVLNFIEGIHRRIEFEQGDTMLCLTTVSFDIFVLETLFPLLKGLRIVLADSEDQKNAHALINLIRQGQIDAIQITPSHLKLLLSEKQDLDFLVHVKVLMIGGEALPAEVLAKVKTTYKGKVYNMYGPTETTVWSTIRDLTETDRVDIGTPIANTTIRILDSENNLQPLGVAGELHIGGLGVTRGYFNDSEQTQERYITDPVTGEAKLYKTGDLARWLPYGNIDYLGRKDNQVKINGFRIELGEIESQLLIHNQVEEAAVVAKEKDGNKFLVAYYVSNEAMDTLSLRSHLAATLPAYMVPSFFVHLSELPLTPNGKLDRKALPDPEISREHVEQPPNTKEEKQLAEVWSQVLGIDKLGVTDNFFAVGGDSIKSIQIGSRLRALGYEVTVQDIFVHQTIRDLAANLVKLSNTADSSIAEKSTVPVSSRPDYEKLFVHHLDALQDQYDLENIYPLSPTQEVMLFHSLLDREGSHFFRQLTCHMKGQLDVEVIEKSMNDIIARYDILRTVFIHEDYERPLQVVLKERKIDFAFEDVRKQCEKASVTDIIEAYQLEDRARKFDLRGDVLMRLTVLQTAEDEFEFMWSYHHILMDGWCMGIIVNEFTEIYSRHAQGGQVSLPAARPYAEYINWLEVLNKEMSAQYWHKYLSGYEQVATLPQREAALSGLQKGGRESLQILIGEAQNGRLQQIARKHKVTLISLLQSAWGVLLAKYNNADDAVFGTVVSGRPVEIDGIENMIGLFINTLPVRVSYKEHDSFGSLMKKIQGEAAASTPHHYHPLAEVQSLSELGSELFNHILIFENYPLTDEIGIYAKGVSQQSGFSISNVRSFDQANYDFALSIYPGNEIHARFDYDPAVYAKSTIQKIKDSWLKILDQIIDQSDRLVSGISIISEQEQTQILQGFNNTFTEISRDKTLASLFQQQVEKTPLRTAVEHNGISHTYADLSHRVMRLSSCLLSKGVRKGDKVAIYQPRSIDLLTSILAIFQIGGSYVPIDENYPVERVKEILSNSESEMVLTNSANAETIEALKHSLPHLKEHLVIDELSLETYPAYEEVAGTVDDLAYIIYTSGTTGKPKGVMIHQMGMINHLFAKVNDLELTSDDVIAQTASPCFDISVWQFLAALLVGGKTHIIDSQTILEPKKLVAALKEGAVTVFESVPSLIITFLDGLDLAADHAISSLRWMIPTGEALTADLVNKWYAYFPEIPLLNAYGPTEASDDITHYVVPQTEDASTIPIGTPVQNTHIYVMDQHLNLCPIGVQGEICVAGLGVGMGYWKNEEKTQKAFKANPFAEYSPESSYKTLYKTGDIGYYLESGDIVCLGRVDEQVKIRGNRIELGEIENVLTQIDNIDVAAVLVKEQDGDKFLTAYYTSEEELEPRKIKEQLTKKLPDYMIPAYYMRLEEFPLTVNGKLDKKAFPDPTLENARTYQPPGNEVEEQLQEIWSQVLKMNKGAISVSESFFELGGHSLKVTQLVNRINKYYQVEVRLSAIFQRQTIQELAEYLMILKQVELAPTDNDEIIEISL